MREVRYVNIRDVKYINGQLKTTSIDKARINIAPALNNEQINCNIMCYDKTIELEKAQVVYLDMYTIKIKAYRKETNPLTNKKELIKVTVDGAFQ